MTDTTLMPDAVRVHDQEFIERLVMEVAREDNVATRRWAVSNGWEVIQTRAPVKEDGTFDNTRLFWTVERVAEKVF